MKKDKIHYLMLTVGAGTGLAAAFLQTIEKLVLLENKMRRFRVTLIVYSIAVRF